MKPPVILCVDDENAILDGLTEQLQQRLGTDYLIEGCESGEDALTLLDELGIENVEVPVAIVDYLMPGMKGDELMKQIQLKSPTTLTILLSGHAGQEEIGKSINTGNLYRYLAKPWNKEDLFLIINDAINVFNKQKIMQQHEEEIKKLNASLKEKVDAQTKKLADQNKELLYEIAQRKRTEKELQQAKNAAENASLAKNVFLANMSHELRTPLNAILGYAEILERQKNITEKQKDELRIIFQSGQHLLTLINDILDISKIEAGKLEIYPTSIAFSNFIEAVVGIIRGRAASKEILFNFEADKKLPVAIMADEKRLRQVLLNLLGNAIKFTDVGTVTLRLSVRKFLEKEGKKMVTLRFEVQDTGTGMTPKQLEKIFIPFEQVGEERRRTQGTGLGLSITQQLVKLMQSEIKVTSELHFGSRFWFDLTVPSLLTAHEEKTYQEIIGYQGQRIKVLVVDDKQNNRLLLLNLLQPLGLTVTLAQNGQESVTKADEIKPDLILMDLFMPEMNGVEAMRHIRQIPALKKNSHHCHHR